ncbi:endonuclease/exonuclease/phosphatase family protein [Cognatishimia sp. F0-27]|uniref:endonuclease/exonuclease/phosphatase family protein n=1 Tax=Cognatishimia sp. F0-27 TaxID=2816855 RepID=UPI001D0CCBBE|nr:endonuclease/exonuclease/phosphatase family protein [Cognatishimia sp. F0-27]MCC1491225.1 endonuclease/exonuclease/phosphatase family protein [Cognatishimia sp. F0-27]
MTQTVSAETLRIATWNGDFSRKGPGLLLRDLLRDDPVPGIATLDAARADVLLLTDVDYDAGLVALKALQARLANPFEHLFALRPNTGMPTGVDIDGDGLLGGPRDAQGYGWFSGQGGMAILSRHPITLRADYADMLWKDLPGTAIAADDPAHALQLLSHGAHWAVDIAWGDEPLTLLTMAATPPVFDGPDDRNGRRNADELKIWRLWRDGAFGDVPPHPVILIGKLNIDPDPSRGEGRRGEITAVLNDARLQDPLSGIATAEFERAGPMRINYVLPDARLRVTAAGVLPPEPGAGVHQLVWVDLGRP